jgi:hypothetical protein
MADQLAGDSLMNSSKLAQFGRCECHGGIGQPLNAVNAGDPDESKGRIAERLRPVALNRYTVPCANYVLVSSVHHAAVFAT